MVNGIINQQTSRGATGSPGVGGAYAPSCLEPKLKAKKTWESWEYSWLLSRSCFYLPNGKSARAASNVNFLMRRCDSTKHASGVSHQPSSFIKVQELEQMFQECWGPLD